MKFIESIKRNTLFRGAFNLMLSSGIISAFGFVFWIIVARQYSSHSVGVATALLSSALLFSLFGQVGFDTTFIRFLPKAKNKSAVINTGLAISGIASACIAAVLCFVLPLLSHDLSSVLSNPANSALFVIFVVFAAWNTLTNAALIAYRKTIYVLLIDLAFSAVKVSLLFFITSGGPITIFMLVAIAQIVNVALSIAVLVKYFEYKPKPLIDRAVVRETRRYSLGVYAANIVNMLPETVLPLIVINRLGASSAAYFYVVYSIASLIYTVVYTITKVLLAETSNDEENFLVHARKGFNIAFALITPAIVISMLIAPFLLNLFGSSYAKGGLGTLRIMVFSGFFVLAFSFLSFYFKHKKKLLPNMVMAVVNTSLTIVLSITLSTKHGLIGVGWAWIIGTVVSVIIGGILSISTHKRRIFQRSTPKYILVSHVYSEDNKGDAALLGVLLDDIREVYPKSSVTILTLDSIPDKHEFEGASVINSFMYYSLTRFHSRPMKLLYSLFVMVSTLIWAFGRKTLNVDLWIPSNIRNVCRIYWQSDLVIPVGGGYLRSQKKGITSLFNVLQLLHPYLLSKTLGKPTVLYTQSIGPFSSIIEEKAVAFVLNTSVSAAIIREDVSMRLLKKIGVTIPTYRSVDSGFSFQSNNSYDLRRKLNIRDDQIIFGLTARKWLNKHEQERYERAIAKTIDHIIKKHKAVVVMIPQVTSEFHGDDDRLVHQRIESYVESKNAVFVIEDKLTHREIKSAYDSLNFLIGTRFHSIIFALTSHVPSIAIEYEHKTSGIMHDLNLDDWVIKMEDVKPDTLVQLTDKLIANQQSYKQQLVDTIPAYAAKARSAQSIVATTYASFIERYNKEKVLSK